MLKAKRCGVHTAHSTSTVQYRTRTHVVHRMFLKFINIYFTMYILPRCFIVVIFIYLLYIIYIEFERVNHQDCT